jgi:uncharacterized protein YcfJ
MNKQIFVSLIAAVSLLGASAGAFADDDRGRDRNGGWKVEKQDQRDRDGKYIRDRRDRHDDRRPEKVSRERDRNDRHKGKPDRHEIKREKDRHGKPQVIVIDRGDRYRGEFDHWNYNGTRIWNHGHSSYRHSPGRARVVSVVPVHKVIRQGRHCRSDYGLGDWIEFRLGDLLISTGNNRDDCYYVDREVRKHYRVTYKYKGRLHTARMHRHPGKYVRVNRKGDLIRGHH